MDIVQFADDGSLELRKFRKEINADSQCPSLYPTHPDSRRSHRRDLAGRLQSDRGPAHHGRQSGDGVAA